ncbi:MFS transporter [Oceanobacillus alkalisoli]|uniref:MFS transporter n=1 Tax=Oceanobacillus alkalisoli TaxID=2925113 RepID=UPI001EEFF05C|nr:MFS transporter [Oceanobacillus alkalisoli]MCF3944121.1 MFS transporter [Oceanobacillus alkalisoli]MCG5102530.1 MFS transporter [Oceanobacillus alkalisoli]
MSLPQTADKSPKSNGKIGFTEKVGYGLGDLATNFAWASMSMFIVYFYTDVVGISAGIIGTIILLSRFLDGVSDIAMGGIIDKTKSKHGKARPWILWLTIPFVVVMVLLFTVPGVSDLGKIIYVAITYNLVILLYTGVVIPYGTLNTLMTPDQNERGVLNVYRMFFATIGIIVVGNLVLPMVNFFGGGQVGWIGAYSVLALVAAIMYMVTFFTSKERTAYLNKDVNKEPFWIGFKALVKNKYWIMVLFMFILYYVNDALYNGGTIYYAEYILGNPALVGLLTLCIQLPALLLIPFLAPLMKKFGKTKLMIGGTLLFIAGSILIIINPTSLTVVIIGSILRGIGRVPLFGLIFALLPDTVEYGEWKTGVRREGLVYSGGSMGTKIGTGIGAASVGWILSFGGYVGGQAIQSDTAIFAINALFLYLPIVTFVLLVLLLSFYKLDKEYPQIINDLRARKGLL